MASLVRYFANKFYPHKMAVIEDVRKMVQDTDRIIQMRREMTAPASSSSLHLYENVPVENTWYTRFV